MMHPPLWVVGIGWLVSLAVVVVVAAVGSAVVSAVVVLAAVIIPLGMICLQIAQALHSLERRYEQKCIVKPLPNM